MFNPHQENLIQKLEDWSSDSRFPPSIKSLFTELLHDARQGQKTYNDIIADLEMTSLRNPAFHGDLLGWLDDDFEEEDDEEEDKD